MPLKTYTRKIREMMYIEVKPKLEIKLPGKVELISARVFFDY